MSLEAEQHLIGCALIDDDSVSKLIEIPEEWFLINDHKIIHREFKRLAANNLSTDMFALTDAIERLNGKNEALGIEYLNTLAENVPNIEHWASYKTILFTDYKKNRIEKTIQNLNNKIKSGENIADVILYMQESVFELLTDHNESKPEKISHFIDQVIDEIQWKIDNPNKLRGKETGFTELDQTINGFEDGKMYLIAARPAMGKTQFGLINLGLNLSRENQVVAFSLEMTGKGLAQRAICNAGNLNSYRINSGVMSDDEWGRLSAAVSVIHDQNKLFIDETPNLSTAQIRARCKAQELKNGKIGVIIIDHVGLIKKDPKKSETEALTKISHELASMAKEFNCPMIVLSQLNRGVESRQDKRPLLSDLKQSGALEEDARCVMMLYRDDYYNPDSANQNVTEVIITKNSDGETKTLFFSHDLGKATYAPIDGFIPQKTTISGKGDF